MTRTVRACDFRNVCRCDVCAYTRFVTSVPCFRVVSILTNGIMDYLQKKWLSREFHDQPLTEADSIGATIGHVQGLLIIFGLSVCVATAVMLVELAVSWSKRPPDGPPVPRPVFPRFYQ